MHLRDYQEEGSEAALVKSRGIISHATGSGKTVTAAVTSVVRQFTSYPTAPSFAET